MMIAFRAAPEGCRAERKLVGIQYSSRCCVCRSLLSEPEGSHSGSPGEGRAAGAGAYFMTPQCISQKTGNMKHVPGRGPEDGF